MPVVLLTILALVAFAANSLLCRMALGGHLIDPVSFTTIRLVSGAAVLVPLARLFGRENTRNTETGTWRSSFALFAYAISFSLAYISLSTGMGALILFGAVQLTMMSVAVRSGERLRGVQWVGFGAAVAGLVYLVLPGISAPSPLGALLMAMSGMAWGLYSIAGKGTTAPIAMTSGNFLRTVPMTLLASAIAFSHIQIDYRGMILALVSGIITSGFGYVLWYKSLPMLTTAQASIVQLVVPVIAALAGVIVLSEKFSPRLTIATACILGGVALAVLKKKETPGSETKKNGPNHEPEAAT